MPSLLCVTAHPDDESAGFGGSLLSYAERGVETAVICLTAGTAARHRGSAKSDAELAQLRRDELKAACKKLNVGRSEVLDYPDGALPRLDFYAAVGDIVARIRRIKPDVLLTFGGEGSITGHLDHGMAGTIATMAFHWAGRADRYPEQNLEPHRTQKLYYSASLFTMPERPPVALPPVTTTIDIAPFLERKIEAFKQHTTQSPLFPIFERNIARYGAKEHFHLVASVTPRTMELEADLFAGLKEN
jgi:LmbE family N-acetylglucosaminyl deacetylase